MRRQAATAFALLCAQVVSLSVKEVSAYNNGLGRLPPVTYYTSAATTKPPMYYQGVDVQLQYASNTSPQLFKGPRRIRCTVHARQHVQQT